MRSAESGRGVAGRPNGTAPPCCHKSGRERTKEIRDQALRFPLEPYSHTRLSGRCEPGIGARRLQGRVASHRQPDPRSAGRVRGDRGDTYLRRLLIQGARSSLQRAKAVATAKATSNNSGFDPWRRGCRSARCWSPSPTSMRASCGSCWLTRRITTPAPVSAARCIAQPSSLEGSAFDSPSGVSDSDESGRCHWASANWIRPA